MSHVWGHPLSSTILFAIVIIFTGKVAYHSHRTPRSLISAGNLI